ncbi:MAG: hypothetical protein KDD02_05845 [Phaeodactylibacter sp.]|nr:hypothetical protein [Phaeodactylibacter sp.]
MNNKKTTQYLLAALAIGIWATIGYRIFRYTQPGNNYITHNAGNLPVGNTTAPAPPDTFTIRGGYEDPFLKESRSTPGTHPRRSHSRGTSGKAPGSRKKSAEKAEKETAAEMPRARYRGYSINDGAITRARVDINGKSYTLRLNGQAEGMALRRMEKSHIIMEWQGKEYRLERQ